MSVFGKLFGRKKVKTHNYSPFEEEQKEKMKDSIEIMEEAVSVATEEPVNEEAIASLEKDLEKSIADSAEANTIAQEAVPVLKPKHNFNDLIGSASSVVDKEAMQALYSLERYTVGLEKVREQKVSSEAKYAARLKAMREDRDREIKGIQDFLDGRKEVWDAWLADKKSEQEDRREETEKYIQETADIIANIRKYLESLTTVSSLYKAVIAERLENLNKQVKPEEKPAVKQSM